MAVGAIAERQRERSPRGAHGIRGPEKGRKLCTETAPSAHHHLVALDGTDAGDPCRISVVVKHKPEHRGVTGWALQYLDLESMARLGWVVPVAGDARRDGERRWRGTDAIDLCLPGGAHAGGSDKNMAVGASRERGALAIDEHLVARTHASRSVVVLSARTCRWRRDAARAAQARRTRRAIPAVDVAVGGARASDASVGGAASGAAQDDGRFNRSQSCVRAPAGHGQMPVDRHLRRTRPGRVR